MEKKDQPIEKFNESTNLLCDKIDHLCLTLEKLPLSAYFELLERPSRMVYLNFLAGLARGIGMAIGFAVLSGAIVYLLSQLVQLNLPLIGGIIADIVKIVRAQMGY